MISLVIRTLNEAEKLALLLKDLKDQTLPMSEVEVIVVDNESSDGTPQIAQKHGFKLVTLPRNEFTYPKSMNLGVEAATNEVVILTVGHARLFRADWLEVAVKTFKDPSVAGLYSPVIPLREGSWLEKFFYYPNYLQARLRGPYRLHTMGMGVMGATNSVIRKSLWEKHHFDNTFECGGEDGEWTKWVMEQGYAIVCDSRFSVRHSHQLDLAGLKAQLGYWGMLGKPSKFDRKQLSFRHDIKFD
ncbi:MAG: glycosyltransferase [Candidatus Parcubacteria bacterium]|nr:glycosyltransferase [Candidatus Parcubacteria bacterium]